MGRGRMRVLALVLLTAIAGTASARSDVWLPVAISDDHSSWLFIDQSSIVHKQKKASVRVLLEYAKPQAGFPETHGEPYLMVRSLMSFNCANRTLLPLEEEYLGEDESLLGQIDVSEATWDEVLPDSLIEPVYDRVCQRK